jgi:selenocysteine-specific elongation factor
MHIIGTAGHVDHGKSSLVLALTGYNPDRLIEEQRRGMTLDLGFAPLRFPDGVEAGIIDVPGHERFLHNMLAGAAGMELLLLVVAATEGPRPQTIEHLHIVNFLNASRALIVLTKMDLVGPEEIAIAADLVRDVCRGTVAQDAPLFPVSCTTGEGIPQLKAAIHDALAALPPRPADAPAFLPIDRVFAVAGHGTVVTGTLMQGRVRVGDTLALQPSGLPARIKGLQIFNRPVREATGGSRVAVNIAGLEVSQVVRGEALVSPREFAPSRELSVEFTPLPEAAGAVQSRMPVRVHIGSAEILGRMRLGGAPAANGPQPARLVLRQPAVFYPGMRIIIRRMSPKDVLGGGKVVAEGVALGARDAAAPNGTAREVAGHDGAAHDPGEFAGAPPATAAILDVLERSHLRPLTVEQTAARANVAVAHAQEALEWLAGNGRVVRLAKPVEYLPQSAAQEAFERVRLFLDDLHARAPWRLGATAAELAAALGLREELVKRLLTAWHDDGRLGLRVRFWHLPEFSPSLTKEQRAFFEQRTAVAREAPYVPRPYGELERATVAAGPEMREALESLLTQGVLVRVGEDVYRRSQIEAAQTALHAYLQTHGAATMAQLRDVLGTSRKYALPLMEYFDSLGFTVRDGELRRLRAPQVRR